MNYWIISPNASGDSENQEAWKELIQLHQVAFMGWGTDHPLGKAFANEVKMGDVILIAQGANRQKRLFLCGIVSSDVKNEEIEGAPQKAFYRELNHVINKEQLDKLNLDFNGTAYGDADRIPAIYKLKPWQTAQDKVIAETLYNKILEMEAQEEMNKSIAILKSKKQIILQGPPGTGKTRLAKIIAEHLTKPQVIAVQDIDSIIKVGLLFNSSTDYTQYVVESISDPSIQVKTKTGKSYPASKSKIIDAYSNKLWLGGQKNGSDPYEAAIAKYIFENIGREQYNIIQFHPAYSYEDFVRGITAKSTGNGIEYKTENRVLAKFASIAYKNYTESRKDVEVISKDRWLEGMFEDFKDSIEDEVEEKGKFPISRSAHIFDADESAFKYTGDNWGTNFRMPFSDILKLYGLGVKERKQIKKQPDVSGRARQHATYYFNVLKKFNDFLAGKPYVEQVEKKLEEKKYILIIDEINRANLPAVLGELIYALEYRGEAVESMYELDESRKIIIPPNLYIIGTMNTADRSVGHIDYAIRRRFAFVDVSPSSVVIDEVIKDAKLNKKAKDLYAGVAALFTTDLLAPDFKAKDVQLGHSYFLAETEDQLKLKLDYEIIPLLIEYLKDGIFKDEKIIDKINALNV